MHKRTLVLLSSLAALLLPASASAELLQIYGNGHGSYLSGDPKHSYFAKNDAGLGYGFTVGIEALMVDLFLDANFHPAGSAWNQIGLGFDLDVVPGPLYVEPTAQFVYFFGKQSDGSEGIKGLFPRAGVQAGVEFAKVMYAGAEGYAGYIVSLPEPEGGFTWIAAAVLGIRFGI